MENKRKYFINTTNPALSPSVLIQHETITTTTEKHASPNGEKQSPPDYY